MIGADEYRNKVVVPHAGKPLVVNFWASWCAPCIAELPALEGAWKESGKNKYGLVLVSIDTRAHHPKAEKILADKRIRLPSVLIDVRDPETFIYAVDSSWSGTVPYTLVYDGAGKIIRRLEGEQSGEELRGELNKLF